MPRTAATAAGTSWCGNARMCSTGACCGPRTGPMRSQGLSTRNSMATAHSNTARDALAYAPRGLRLRVPDGGEDLQDIRACHLGDQARADAGEGVALQARQPALRVPAVAPAGLFLRHHLPGSVGERRRALRPGASRRAGRRPRWPACGWRAPSRALQRAAPARCCRVPSPGAGCGRRAAGPSSWSRTAGRRDTILGRHSSAPALRHAQTPPRAPCRDGGLWAWFLRGGVAVGVALSIHPLYSRTLRIV